MSRDALTTRAEETAPTQTSTMSLVASEIALCSARVDVCSARV